MAKKAYIGVDGVARKIKKGYIGVENFVPRALPSGYTQLSRIESTGAQYFDTGFKPNNNTRVVMDIEVTSGMTSFLFGARNSTTLSTSNSFSFPQINGDSLRSDYGFVEHAISVNPLQRLKIDKNKNVTTVNGATVTASLQTFQCNYSLFLFSINTAGTKYDRQTVAKLYSCQIYDNGTLVRDYVPCTNSAGTAGLYDMANGIFYQNAGTGTFAVGATHGSFARKIKKAYIGIGGVARPCLSSEELAYYGTITALSAARHGLAAATVGNYALFAGGDNGSHSKVVDAYTSGLSRSTPTALRYVSDCPVAASIGNYALFGSINGAQYVDAYNTSLSRSAASNLTRGSIYITGATVGNYALFAGGWANFSTAVSNVDSYDTSLTKKAATALEAARYQMAATTVGNYAIFGGGFNQDYLYNVTTYNASLTRGYATDLSAGRALLAASTVGDYALFGGGDNWDARSAVVDAYSSSLTRTTPTALSAARSELSATTVGNYAIFGGGYVNGSVSNVVDVYDASLTRTTMSLSAARRTLAAITIGGFALFAGGDTGVVTGGKGTNVVDAFTVA